MPRSAPPSRRDYERAIGPQTALLMKVHPSNYSIEGFTASVDEAELAAIARQHGIPLACDLGSGSLVDLAAYGPPREPLPREKISAGCDVVTFSGDKLLGGPQAGILVGSRAAIGRIRKDPMKRALRVSKLVLAALEATLRLYLRPERLARDLPTLRLLTRRPEEMERLGNELLPALQSAVAPRFSVTLVPCESQIGSGALPVERLPSFALALAPHGVDAKGIGGALEELASVLRALPVPVVGRISRDSLQLDLRCLEEPSRLTAQLPRLREMLFG